MNHLELLQDMIRVRRMEERCMQLYTQEKIRGFLHLYIGEEAIAAGVISHLRLDDAVLATYREHGHALLKGVSMNAIMAEMFGKVTGCSRGRGGSMHLFSRPHHFYGGNAIVCGHLPVAVGMALADKMQNRDRVTVCFFGEGASAEGEFHESLNLAALWELPVLFCCENNLYAMGTALDRSESQPDIHLKAASYNVVSKQVDGMDVLACYEAAGRAIDAIRDGAGPHFLEFKTYRLKAHSMFDAELYRDKAEVERWKDRDPIPRFEKLLREHSELDDDTLASIEARAKEEVDAAVAFAEAGDWESIDELERFVHSETAPQEAT
jgi:pyruvate dehydrogenase E1 component alpha subunit